MVFEMRAVCARFCGVTVSLLILLLIANTEGLSIAQQLVITMTPEDVEQAIQLAGNEKSARKFLDAYVVQSRAGWGHGPLIGSFSTPFARVVQAAASARKNGKHFSSSDVRPEMIAPEVHVIAVSQKPAEKSEQIATIESVSIARRGSATSTVLTRPIRTMELSNEYQSIYGLSFEAPGLVAVFPLNVVAAENEIRVTFSRIVRASWGSAACRQCTVLFHVSRVR